MLLWDSRTIHRNSSWNDIRTGIVPDNLSKASQVNVIQHSNIRELNPSDDIGISRIVSYVCMVPRTRVSSENIGEGHLFVVKAAPTLSFIHVQRKEEKQSLKTLLQVIGLHMLLTLVTMARTIQPWRRNIVFLLLQG